MKDTGSILTIGTLSGGDTSGGGTLLYYNSDGSSNSYNVWAGVLNIYNSYFYKHQGWFRDPSMATTTDIRNSLLEDATSVFYWMPGTNTVNLRNVIFSYATSGRLYLYGSNTTVNNITIARGTGIYCGGSNVVLANIA